MIEIWHDLYMGKVSLYDTDMAEARRGKLGKTLSRALTWQGTNIFVTLLRASQLEGAAR